MTEERQPGAWRDAGDACPCCQRPFLGVMDHPRIRLMSMERLALPEILDYYSEEAMRRQVRGEPGAAVIRTQELSDVMKLTGVRDWLDSLAGLVGHVVEPAMLMGAWPAGRFTHARSLTGTPFSIGLNDGNAADGERSCILDVLLPGPNLGSAGGPTLAHVGHLASFTYEGLVAVHA